MKYKLNLMEVFWDLKKKFLLKQEDMQFFHEKQHECYFWICPLLRASKRREKQGRKGISFSMKVQQHITNLTFLYYIQLSRTATNKPININ